MASVSAILLAAGLSRRMGDPDKLLLDWQGQPMIAHCATQLAESQAAEILLVANPTNAALMPKTDRLRLIVNPDYTTGMTSSIQAGVRTADPQHAGLMICLGDMPLLQTALIDQLLAVFAHEQPLVLQPSYQGQPGHPVIFHRQLAPDLLAHTLPEGCKALIQRYQAQKHTLPVNTPAILRDVDTPAAYQQLKAEAIGKSPA